MVSIKKLLGSSLNYFVPDPLSRTCRKVWACTRLTGAVERTTFRKFCLTAMALQQKLPPTDWGVRPTSSAEKRIVSMVFRRHYDQLAGGIVNPDRLTTLLYAKGLISTGTRDEVLTTQGLPRIQKVVKILNAVEAMLLTHHKPAVALKEFCRAVKNQPALKPVAKDIRSELGERKFTDKHSITTGADPEINP